MSFQGNTFHRHWANYTHIPNEASLPPKQASSHCSYSVCGLYGRLWAKLLSTAHCPLCGLKPCCYGADTSEHSGHRAVISCWWVYMRQTLCDLFDAEAQTREEEVWGCLGPEDPRYQIKVFTTLMGELHQTPKITDHWSRDLASPPDKWIVLLHLKLCPSS